MPIFKSINLLFIFEKMDRVAEWSALSTGNRGDPSSIPVKVKTFFGVIMSLELYIAYSFELNKNFELN